MNYYLSERFVLRTDAARRLYRGCADMPVYDFHNHLSAEELYRNENYRSLTQFWLAGDHYKWRAMRLAGVDEEYITGGACDREKFMAFSETLSRLVGCPLYAWAQSELAMIFGEEEPLTAENAAEIYERCNRKLAEDDFKPLALLRRFKVKAMCTTDEPASSLEWHNKAELGGDIKVLPGFRPDRVITAEAPSWREELKKLEKSENMKIDSLSALKKALAASLDRFAVAGCRMSDHGFEGLRYTDTDGADAAFDAAFAGKSIGRAQADALHSELLEYLAQLYAERDMTMQLHIGALRNISSRMYENLGADCGCDCADECFGARSVSGLLDALDKKGKLPRTILYCLNDGDYTSLVTLAASFAGGRMKSRVQLGSAWWFNDTERGMREQLAAVMENAMLPGFAGMLTDSRSIGSFVRHDYFRRVLCDAVGAYVESGEFADIDAAEQLIADVCFKNAAVLLGGNENETAL